MSTLAIDDVVRYLLVTSIAAAVLVCLCFSVAVWARRNKVQVRLWPAATGVLIALGLFGMVAATARHLLVVHKGIVEASDIYAVRSKVGGTATVVSASGDVRQGEPLVRFDYPGLQARLAGLDSRIMVIRERLRALDLQPLQLSVVLAEERRRLQDDLARSQTMLLDLQKSSRENRRSLLDTQSRFIEKLGELNLQIQSSRQVSSNATAQLAITDDALGRSQYLRQQGIENISNSENRLADRLSKELTLKRAASDIVALQGMQTDLGTVQTSSLAFLDTMQVSLDDQIESERKSGLALRTRLTAMDDAQAADRLRAGEARLHDREALQHEIAGIEEDKASLLATTVITAPFSGTIIYRNPAAGIVSDNSLLVALAPSSGFLARIRVGNDELPFVDPVDRFRFELADADLLTRFVPGLYRGNTPAPFEDDQSIVTFDLKLPSEVVERLTRTAEPLGIKLVWTGPLWSNPLFRYSLVLLSGALVLACFGRLPKMRSAGVASVRAARLVIPLLWLCAPTEAIAREDLRHAQPGAASTSPARPAPIAPRAA